MEKFNSDTKFICIKDYAKVIYSTYVPPKQLPTTVKEGEIHTFSEIMRIDHSTSMNDLNEFFLSLAEWREKQLNDILED